MDTTTINLPSGREVTYRKATAYDNYRLQGALPDLAASAEDIAEKMTRRDFNKLGIRTVCQLSVKPRFWADLRDDAEYAAAPLTCPPGFVDFDLTQEDFEHLIFAIWGAKQTEVEETAPLPVTVGA